MFKLIGYVAIFILLINNNQGNYGYYNITGKAYDANGFLLRKENMTLTMESYSQKIVIDSLGNYKAKIPWETICSSGAKNGYSIPPAAD